MFFKKKNQNACAEMKVVTFAGLGGATTLATSGVHEEIERQVKKRLANEKFFAEFAAAPAYKISESYDVKTHKDTFFLLQKQQYFQGGWKNGVPESDYRLVYSVVFSSDKKSEVMARFARVMPKKGRSKKAA